MVVTQFFGKSSLQEKGHLAVEFWQRLGMLNGKWPHFRLTWVAQKRLCLSSLISVRWLPPLPINKVKVNSKSHSCLARNAPSLLKKEKCCVTRVETRNSLDTKSRVLRYSCIVTSSSTDPSTSFVAAFKYSDRNMSSYKPTEEEKERFMSRAIELSDEGPSKGHGGPFGAVIVKGGKIIGE